MKKTARILVAVMTALLALPFLCGTARAEDTYTFTVNEPTEGYTYVLYQMFTGDTSGAGTEASPYVLSNVDWGSSVPKETQQAMYTKFGLTGTNQTAAKVAEAIAEAAKTDSNVFHSMMAYMNELGKNNGASLSPYKTLTYNSSANPNCYQATDLPAGYYLVRNTAVPSGNSTATYSDYIVEVVGGNVAVDPKASVGASEKKVADINDSNTAGLVADQDSADYDIGDTIPFTLTATLPENYASYSSYQLIFEDDISAGLTLTGIPKIYYGATDTTGADITFQEVTGARITVDGQEVTLGSAYTGGKVYKAVVGDLKATDRSLAAGDSVRIEYTAQLNANAIVGSTGNANRHRIIYSNSPTDASKLGASNYDTNIVFTYRATFNKVDPNNQALNGADFTLEKFVANSSGTDTVGGIKGTWTNVTALHAGSAVNPTKTGNTSGNTFSFAGLDDGHYRLRETTTPTGYNTMTDQEFDIVATHTNGDTPTLTALSGTDGAEFTMTANVGTATLSANIKNERGTILPTTGGMGTTALYVVGSVLLVGAVVAFVVKRRMATK